eukprot:gnl/TRDRNA2_/TRDRNA2_154911_c0_seq1.p1 gnl/TRDRNA2_/TRDRNA2_154911_c0~~gnl/TRDRNA2_/TRDRNA2_154911_c0_seq1.p1  ORF type:complete len:512 (+),score=50.97 gnl/TRDRNA2_/TRDRNA2_154911_c0_seq1:71-1606(+)
MPVHSIPSSLPPLRRSLMYPRLGLAVVVVVHGIDVLSSSPAQTSAVQHEREQPDAAVSAAQTAQAPEGNSADITQHALRATPRVTTSSDSPSGASGGSNRDSTHDTGSVSTGTPSAADGEPEGQMPPGVVVTKGESLEACKALVNFTNSAAVSPVAIYSSEFTTWLRETQYQAAVAVFAICVGCVCLWDGPAIWHVLFTVTVAVAAAGVVKAETANTMFAKYGVVLGMQAFVAVGLAVHLGFEGFQVLLGIALGVLGAHEIGGWLTFVDSQVPAVALAWYSLFGMMGFLVYTVWRKPVLAVLAPLLGGLLVASGTGLLVSIAWSAVNVERAEQVQNLTAYNNSAAGTPLPKILPAAGEAWFPKAGSSWFDAAYDLAGGGFGASIRVLCAVGGAVSHALLRRREISALCLGCGIWATALLSASGLGCRLIGISCPLIEAPREWRWMLCGCGLWALFSTWSTWCQLADVDWDPRGGTVLPWNRGVRGYVVVDDRGIPSSQLGQASWQTRNPWG